MMPDEPDNQPLPPTQPEEPKVEEPESSDDDLADEIAHEPAGEPDDEVEEPRKPGFHVLHELGHLLGIYPTREDAQAFIDGHYPAGTIEHVTG